MSFHDVGLKMLVSAIILKNTFDLSSLVLLLPCPSSLMVQFDLTSRERNNLPLAAVLALRHPQPITTLSPWWA